MNNSRAINRVFTRNVLKDLLSTGSSEVFDYVASQYVDAPDTKTYSQIFSEIYTFMGKEKRNEYYYMNTLLNKLVLGIHSINTATALSQVKIAAHIADFVLINGEGRVYEVKSEFDNLDRLSDQLSDYFRAFNKVSVISAQEDMDKIARLLEKLGDLGDSVGIYCLTKEDRIFGKNSFREPKQYDDNLEHSAIFKLLRKKEYLAVIHEYFGAVPEVQPVFIFRACLEKFSEIPLLEAQKLTCMKLKERSIIKQEEIDKVQQELKSVVYFSELGKMTAPLEEFLCTPYRR